MNWVRTYLVGFVIVIGAVLAALWKLGILQNIETIWKVIGFAAPIGVGIMISIANSGAKENIQMERKWAASTAEGAAHQALQRSTLCGDGFDRNSSDWD